MKDPCALYTGWERDRCLQFHAQTRKEMRVYHAQEAGYTALAVLSFAVLIGAGGIVAYTVWRNRKGK